jgi:hypothetical protein
MRIAEVGSLALRREVVEELIGDDAREEQCFMSLSEMMLLSCSTGVFECLCSCLFPCCDVVSTHSASMLIICPI